MTIYPNMNKEERNRILQSRYSLLGIPEQSSPKEAINYCLNRWENLENFIKYPGATFSTNAAERSVKNWVTARRNFLFSGSGNGAKASCFILSLIETAKQNGIAPEDYLRCLFEKAPYAETREDWEKLLPWNIEITPYKIRVLTNNAISGINTLT